MDLRTQSEITEASTAETADEGNPADDHEGGAPDTTSEAPADDDQGADWKNEGTASTTAPQDHSANTENDGDGWDSAEPPVGDW